VSPTVHFRSDRFEHETPREDFVNPCCFGEDLAQWLRAALDAAGHRASDRLAIGFVEDAGWQVIVERPASLLAWILGRRAPADRALCEAIHAALAAEPSVRELHWLDTDRRGRESARRPRP
jgi:hypothetical protein